MSSGGDPFMQCTIHIASVSESLSKKFLSSAPGSNCLVLPGRCEESNMYFVAVVVYTLCLATAVLVLVWLSLQSLVAKW